MWRVFNKKKITDTSEVAIHPDYGVFLRDRSWVPAPKYLLRRSRLLKILKDLKPGRVLEVGCGAGGITFDATQMGFSCEALETSLQARNIANKILSRARSPVEIHSSAAEWKEEFDVLMSFEVLEHIELDDAALKEWVSWVKPEGYLVLSVPALKSMWGPSDVWAGHYRRYEKDEFIALLNNNGLDCLHFETYGYPLSYITNFVRNIIYSREVQKLSLGSQQGTDRSGVERSKEAVFFGVQASMLGRAFMFFFCKVQTVFSKFGYGDGFIILAKKSD
ncbi:class I SAM-dependent methyltransferase [Shewanella benthica]|uniref:class I SAM-dependent methyltransferase n=1 Tax=Shewanella benthica TaxID=43661 RepID=UPI001879B710|nr:class I SAM-dependent methyltransferase [Shewanella benthica]MBE7214631.1 class I SAM-dependent methyltransferase [Shewanella benthica]MCL1060557.1 class I SAM-dependent methyltransferase [Shewanella benthica]